MSNIHRNELIYGGSEAFQEENTLTRSQVEINLQQDLQMANLD